MSQKTHSQDSNFEETWRKMDEIDSLTPVQKSIDAYKEAAAIDEFLFGDYDYIRTWNNQESNDVY